MTKICSWRSFLVNPLIFELSVTKMNLNIQCIFVLMFNPTSFKNFFQGSIAIYTVHVSPFKYKKSAHGRPRTDTEGILSPRPLPIGVRGLKNINEERQHYLPSIIDARNFTPALPYDSSLQCMYYLRKTQIVVKLLGRVKVPT